MVEYGTTTALNTEGDIFRVGNSTGELLEGLQAVEQELRVMLGTVEGEQPFAEEFGLDVFEILDASDAQIQREIRTTLEYDDRVDSVPTVDIDRSDDNRRQITVDVDVLLVAGERLQFREVIGA